MADDLINVGPRFQSMEALVRSSGPLPAQRVAKDIIIAVPAATRPRPQTSDSWFAGPVAMSASDTRISVLAAIRSFRFLAESP